ncbi:MAG: InlB B-repeat-containing protein [Prevotellaceae bacterium]|jgi:uncharacterized repeat protein (TIGR02543 family)|nr:InlB B-repeat-containing protein [Prevotellaceae bacterium]
MKNLSKISLLFAAVLLFVFTSCGKKTYTVTFDSQGGSAVAPITDLLPNSTIAEPAPPPTKTDCIFEGWYKDAAGTVEWNFATDVVTSDITLYAKWDDASDKVGSYVTWFVQKVRIGADSAYNFEMTLHADGVFENGAFKRQGEVYVFDLYAPTADPAPEKGYIIPTGTYRLDKDNTRMPFTIGDNRYTRIKRASNSSADTWTDIAKFTEGTLTIEKKTNGNYVVKFAGKDDRQDTKTYRLRYEGDLLGHSEAFNKEPLEAVTITKSYTLATSSNYHDSKISGTDYVDFMAHSNANDNIRIGFLLNANTVTFPAGEFNIIQYTKDFNAVPYALASIGWINSAAQPSAITQAGSAVYFLQSGTVKVEPNATENQSKIIVKAKSYFGTEINVTYTGSLKTDTSQ